MYSDKELLEYIKMINWDTPIPNEELLELLKGGGKPQYQSFRKNLYMKIINGFNWHKARHIIPADKLKEALEDDVIRGLFPRNLRDKYKYVQSLL